MKAIILAGGEGKRMQPLTYTRPKAMLYTAGKPLLYHVLSEVKNAGITQAVIVVKYKMEKIIEYFKENNLGMSLEFVEQGEKYGTLEALISAKDKVSGDFLVIAGDLITEAKAIKKVLENHKDKITVGAKRVENPKSYGVFELNGGKIARVEEKPENPKTNIVNTSIYAMNETIFDKLKEPVSGKRKEYELTDLLIGAKCVEINEFWMDVAYPWHLLDAQDYLLPKIKSNTGKGKIENSTIKGKLIMEAGAEIFDSYVGNGIHYLEKGVKIGPHSFLRGNNSIGENSEIGESTSIKNSILFRNVTAKHLTYIGDSIIGENVNFGSGTQIANYRFDEKIVNVSTSTGLVSTGRKKFGAIVGDNSKFGALSCVMPGKTIGSNCWIAPSSLINQNIPNEKRF